jgi:hypothetical protein
MLASRSVVSVLLRGLGDFLYTLKAGPAGGRLRRPSSTGNPTAAGAGRLNASALRRSARRATEYPVDNDAGLLMESAT